MTDFITAKEVAISRIAILMAIEFLDLDVVIKLITLHRKTDSYFLPTIEEIEEVDNIYMTHHFHIRSLLIEISRVVLLRKLVSEETDSEEIYVINKLLDYHLEKVDDFTKYMTYYISKRNKSDRNTYDFNIEHFEFMLPIFFE